MSFFSGALGIDIGLEKAGMEAISYNEIDPICCQTIKANRPGVTLYQKDIRDLSASTLLKEHKLKPGELFAIVGGPPCQSFSTVGKRKSFGDSRGGAFLCFLDLIDEIRPKYVVIENVRGLLSAPYSKGDKSSPLSLENIPGSALNFIVSKLEKSGYTVTFTLYNFANLGVPQARERLIIIASISGKKIPFITKTNSNEIKSELPRWKTTRDAIFDLRGRSDHEFKQFPEKRLKYYRYLKSGQNWKNLTTSLQKKAMGRSYYSGGGKTGFFRRLAWDMPSPTLVTSPTMPATDLCHPDEDRPLSVQEYSRLQTFPDDYIFSGTIKDKYRQIGNAIPCFVGEKIGEHLILVDSGVKIKNNFGDKMSRYNGTDFNSWKIEFKKTLDNFLKREKKS